MKTKYGNLEDCVLTNSENPLVGKIFKLLPMKESCSQTLHEYHRSFMMELHGIDHLALQSDPYFLCLLGSLESLVLIDDISLYRTKVFECITALKQILHRKGGD
jgi:hypothetical protein